MGNVQKRPKNPLRSFILWGLRGYKRWISPLLPGACRFHPTCSRYAYKCFEKFPVAPAFFLTLKRLGRCHPWHIGGLDPVPERIRGS